MPQDSQWSSGFDAVVDCEAPHAAEDLPRVEPVPDRPQAPSRRAMFTAVMAAMAAAGIKAQQARAQAPSAGTPSGPSADGDPAALINKLVDRITFGTTPEELALAQQLGYQGYLEYHLDHLAIDDSAVQTRLAPLTTLTMPYSQLVALNSGTVRAELTEACILRAVYSKRQLFERMVELWTDHFNIDINTALQYKTVDDAQVVRALALSSFPQLLDASARSPAMLYYLNNDVSVAGNPNENYARELMELHTLGVNGGYTQQDVQEVARCLTGWTIWRSSAGPALHGTFRYRTDTHDNGTKNVLGVTIPPGGQQNDGITVLTLLKNHPSTARFIATKLCRHFLGYSVSADLIQRVAGVYTATSGDIKAMLREVLRPEHVAGASPKLKRPFHHAVSAMRALNVNITATTTVRSRLSEAGHAPYSWPTPDGYPDKLDHWASNLIARWNFGASLMNGSTASPGLAGVSVDDAAFYTGLTTADQMADRINQRLLGGKMALVDRNECRDHMLPSPTTARRREALGLAIGSPSFQWY